MQGEQNLIGFCFLAVLFLRQCCNAGKPEQLYALGCLCGCESGNRVMEKRTAVSLALFAGSLAVTAVCFAFGLPFFFLFLFLPLFFLPKREIRRCPVCGCRVAGGDNYCSVCGAKLEE